MGSRSTSSNTSQTEYNTETTNLNLQGVDAGGGNVVAGSSGPVNILDGGAIRESFGFGANALDFAETVNRRAMDEMGRTFTETLGAVNKSAEQIVDKITIDSGERVQKSVQSFVWLAAAAIIGFAVMGKRAA